ncbi:MAG: hypothetical protein Q4G26_15530, partial [Paracoccus sp. (in: a-proteobacteria)]|nr:hypothetical protein [Paracoccus sp. (in: a-proteobacteria)]
MYHVGAYGSGMERIIRTLLSNRDALWKEGVEVPSPGRYRGVFGEALTALNGGHASNEMQEMLLDSVMDSDDAARVVLSQPAFIGMPKGAISPKGLYASAPYRLAGLSNLFPDSHVEFFIGITHPAQQVQTIVQMTKGDYASVMAGVDPHGLLWAPLFRRLLDAVPGRRIVAWAQEDLPFTMPEVLRRMADVPPHVALQNENGILAELLPAEAFSALDTRISAAPGLGIGPRRDLIEKALADVAPSAMEAEIALPGWSQDL